MIQRGDDKYKIPVVCLGNFMHCRDKAMNETLHLKSVACDCPYALEKDCGIGQCTLGAVSLDQSPKCFDSYASLSLRTSPRSEPQALEYGDAPGIPPYKAPQLASLLHGG